MFIGYFCLLKNTILYRSNRVVLEAVACFFGLQVIGSKAGNDTKNGNLINFIY